MEIKLLSFSEALDRMVSGKLPYMIRMKWLEADYLNNVVLLYKTNYIVLSKSCGIGSPEELWFSRTMKNQVNQEAMLISLLVIFWLMIGSI